MASTWTGRRVWGIVETSPSGPNQRRARDGAVNTHARPGPMSVVAPLRAEQSSRVAAVQDHPHLVLLTPDRCPEITDVQPIASERLTATAHVH